MKKIGMYGAVLYCIRTKIWKVMRISIFILLLSVSQGWALSSYSQETHISLNMNNTTVLDVLEKIENSSEFYFLFSHKLINTNRVVNIEVKDKSIDNVLTELFSGTDVNFIVKDRHIVLTPSNENNLNSSGSGEQNIYMQKRSIKGSISDDSGAGIAGVTVMVKGTTSGTISDADGNYTLSNLPADAVLTFSFIGLKSQEITVGSQSVIDVVMHTDAISLNEVVAVGYGTQKRAAISGSVVTVKAKELIETPVTNLSNAIAGRLSGVIVNSPGGDPGADEAQILIRGKGTLGNSSALIIIDGIPDRGGFSRLNSQDIESFTVLKDASAAIYGARAANGVILITTKRGKAGKTKGSISSNVSFSQPNIDIDPLDSWQEATLANEMRINKGESVQWTDEQISLLKDQSQPLQYPNTDWEDILLKDWAKTQNHTVSVRGGSESIRYFLSGQFMKQDGLYKGEDYPYQQISVRANLDAQLTDKLLLGVDLLNRVEDRNYPQIGENSAWSYATRGGRYLVSYFPDGRIGKGWQPGEFNAAESVSSRAGFKEQDDNILNTKISLKWDTPIEGLTLSGYGAFDTQSSSSSHFKDVWDEWLYDYSTDIYSKAVDATERSLSETKADYSTKTYNFKLDYKISSGEHNFDAFVAYEQSRYEMSSLSASRIGFASDLLTELFAGTAEGQNNSGYSNANGRINYFGRINYGYSGKYLATLSLRHDGSQNFPEGSRYGTFPAISLAWRLSEEPFLVDSKIVDNLKLRGSWGQMGNDDVVAFQYQTSYAFTDYTQYGWGVLAGYDYGNGTEPGIFESTTANPNITWETATTSNIGLEGMLFDSKLSFEFDYFMSKRRDILIARNASVPEYTGLTLPDENLGIVDNSGFELQLSYRKTVNGNLSYNIGGNFSYAHNEVVFYDEPAAVKEYQEYEGKPIDSWLGYESVGIYQTQSEIDSSPHGEEEDTAPGDLQIRDLSGDGTIDATDRTRFDYGQVPEIMYGLNMGVTYKSFNISILLQGQARAYVNLNAPFSKDKEYFENRWGNGDDLYPRINDSSYGDYGANSTFWFRKADFLRLKNVNFAYNFSDEILSKFKIESLQLYARGNNLMRIYDNIEGNWRDPEDDNSTYPIQRSLQVGLNLGF